MTMRKVLLVVVLLWIHYVDSEIQRDPREAANKKAGNQTAAEPAEEVQMGPLGLMTMQNFIIMAVVLTLLLVILIGLLIACCCSYCCKSGTSWSDLHPSEIKAGLTPSMADAGITASQVQVIQARAPVIQAHGPLPHAFAPYHATPLSAYNPHPYAVPMQPVPPPAAPVKDKRSTESDDSTISVDSEASVKKKKGRITLKKGVILPAALRNVKPQNKNKARKKDSNDI